MATKMVKKYVCPTCPGKEFTSWRKFSGHWVGTHIGEEKPPKAEVMQNVEVDVEEKAKGGGAEGSGPSNGAAPINLNGAGKVYLHLGDGALPDDPIDRLGTILDVHGVGEGERDQILKIFQINPGYQNNPVNLHYLLASKLSRKFVQQVPMMVNEFTSSDNNTPEGVPFMMGSQNPGMSIPPYLMGSMYGGAQPPYNPYFQYGAPNFAERPIRRAVRPAEGTEDEEIGDDGEPIIRSKKPVQVDPMVQMTGMMTFMGAMMDTMDKMRGSKKPGEGEEVSGFKEMFQDSFTEMSESMKTVSATLAENQEKTRVMLAEQAEQHRVEIQKLKDEAAQAETRRLEEKIAELKEEKEQDSTTSLGGLIKDAATQIGAEASDLRKTVATGMGQVGRIAETAAKNPPQLPLVSLPQGGSAGKAAEIIKKPTTVQDAAKLIDSESKVVGIIEGLKRDLKNDLVIIPGSKAPIQSEPANIIMK